MKKVFQRMLSGVTAIAIVLASGSTSVFANEEEQKTYKYIALGDSVPAGSGLAASNALPYTGLFMRDVIQDGVAESYPMVFGSILDETIDDTYTVITKNLGQCGYSSGNLLSALQGNTEMTTYQQFTIGRYAENAQEILDENKELLASNVADADLISVNVGFNDMSEGLVVPLLEGVDNPLMTVFRRAFLATINGVDVPLENLTSILEESEVTEDNITDFISYVISIPKDMLDSSISTVTNAKAIIKELEAQNEDATIVLISTYSPFGNSNVCDGVTYNAAYVSQEIMAAIMEVYFPDIEIEMASVEEIEAIADQCIGEDAETLIEETGEELSELIALMIQPEELIDELKVEELMENISARLSYIISYDTLGLASGPYLKLTNDGFKQIADGDDKVIYVDIWNIPNEDNSDPHPDAQGHAAIAGFLKDTVLPCIHLEKEAVREIIDEKEYDVVYCAVHEGEILNKTYIKDTEAAIDTAAANLVVEKIKEIGKVAYTNVCKAKIDAARSAYEALTQAQKAKVTSEQLSILTQAEIAYADAEKTASQQTNQNNQVKQTKKTSASSRSLISGIRNIIRFFLRF